MAEGDGLSANVSAASEAKVSNLTSAVNPLAPSQVDHVIKEVLPAGMHMSKEAKVAFHKAASMFIVYIEALVSHEKAQKALQSKKAASKRIMISSHDIRTAVEDAGMAHLVPLMSSNKRTR